MKKDPETNMWNCAKCGQPCAGREITKQGYCCYCAGKIIQQYRMQDVRNLAPPINEDDEKIVDEMMAKRLSGKTTKMTKTKEEE